MQGVHKRRRKWWFRFSYGGKQHLVNTGEEDEGRAIMVAQRIEANPEAFIDSTELEFLLADYLKAKRLRGISSTHLENEEWTLKRFLSDTGLKRPRQITTKAVAAWVAPHVERNGKTGDDYLDRIRRFCRFLVAHGRLVANPCDDIPRTKRRPKPRRRFLNVKESRALLDACDDSDLKTVVYLALHCGLRKGETLAARWSWVDLGAGLLHVQTSDDWTPKDREDRTIPISRELADWLRPRTGKPADFLARPDKEPGEWRNRWEFRRAFASACRRAGLEDVTFHDLRRTFASLHVTNGTPLYVVAKWLGDGHAVVERHYGHLIAQDSRINGPWT